MRGRIFYGWFIVAAGAAAQLLAGGLHHYTYGAYVVLLERDEGWSKTSLSAAYSMARLENGFLGPLEGWLVDRFGPRLVMSMGMLVFGGGFMALSQVDSILAFLIAFGCLALGAGMSSFMPLSVAVVNWFNRKRTTALATMQVGYALGGLAVPLVILSLETFGWRTTAFASGVLVIVIGLPLAQVVRHRPEDYGLQVDGGPPKSAEGARSCRPTCARATRLSTARGAADARLLADFAGARIGAARRLGSDGAPGAAPARVARLSADHRGVWS